MPSQAAQAAMLRLSELERRERELKERARRQRDELDFTLADLNALRGDYLRANLDLQTALQQEQRAKETLERIELALRRGTGTRQATLRGTGGQESLRAERARIRAFLGF